jgi:predicted secreted protein
MSVISALAVYFIIWWVVFFAVLPWGMLTQAEVGEVEPGSVPSAPARPRMWRKALFTTIVAALVQGALWAAIEAGVTIDDLPLPNPLARTLEP